MPLRDTALTITVKDQKVHLISKLSTQKRIYMRCIKQNFTTCATASIKQMRFQQMPKVHVTGQQTQRS